MVIDTRAGMTCNSGGCEKRKNRDCRPRRSQFQISIRSYIRAGFTKAKVIDFYIRVAPFLLPDLKNRPVTLKHFAQGVFGSSSTKRMPPLLRLSGLGKQEERTFRFAPLPFNNSDKMCCQVYGPQLSGHTQVLQ
ncbi:MAG TPA: hypothetical protein DC047_01370 [Blastocatellia bacterium]|nr:hypothetical protein [Blastocatellia bacterium]